MLGLCTAGNFSNIVYIQHLLNSFIGRIYKPKKETETPLVMSGRELRVGGDLCQGRSNVKSYSREDVARKGNL